MSERSDEERLRRLIVVCGPPGTGKTTVATRLHERLTVNGRPSERTRWHILHSDDFPRRPYDRMFRTVAASNADWVLDGTFFRCEWQDRVHTLGEVFVVRLAASLDACLARNEAREESIDERGVRDIYRAFDEPDADLVVDTERVGAGEAVERILRELNARGWFIVS